MSKGLRIWRHIRVKLSLLFAAKLVTSMLAIAFATNIIISMTTYQAEIGGVLSVSNNLLATDKGFSLAQIGSSATTCSSPVTFGLTPGTANTLITGGHMVFDVQINSTTNAPQNRNFTVTFVLASNTYGPVCIKTPASPADGQIIDCKYDVGTVLPSSPYTFKVTVQ